MGVMVNRRMGTLFLVLAGVAYLSWILGPSLNPALDPVHAWVAELAADDQPHEWVFRIGDVLTGTFAGVVAVLHARRASRLEFVAWVCVVVFAVAVMLDAGPFTLTCAPSIDPACAAADRLGTLPFADEIHVFTSAVGMTAIVSATVLFALLARGPVLWATGALVTVASLVTAGGVLFGAGLGWAQRVQLAAISLWLAALGWWQRRAPR